MKCCLDCKSILGPHIIKTAPCENSRTFFLSGIKNYASNFEMIKRIDLIEDLPKKRYTLKYLRKNKYIEHN